MAKSRTTSAEWRTLVHFWHVSLHFKRNLIATLCIPINAITVGTIIPFLIGKALGTLAKNPNQASHYLPYIIGFGIFGAITNRIGYVNQMRLHAKVMAYLQTEALDTLLLRSTAFHNNRVSGKLVSDATDYPAAYSQLNGAIVVNIIPFVVVVLSGIIFVSVESLLLGALLLAMAVFVIGSGVMGTLGRSGLRAVRHDATKAVVSHLADTIVNHQNVKTFAREADELQTHRKLNQRLLDLRLKDWTTSANSNNMRVSAVIAFQIGFVMVLVWMARRNPGLLGVMIFSLSYMMTLTNRLIDVNSVIRTIEDGFLQAKPMMDIIGKPSEILDKPGAVDLQVTDGRINFTDVNFDYVERTGTREVFQDLQIAIKAGEKIGLVGPSGGGKSTLTRLLLRFEDIKAGTIAIDSQDIAGVTQTSLRRAISYVPQEPLLFHRSIRENIAYGDPDADEASVRRAARLAFADGFIEELDEAYDTIVGERGVKLSGGQRQRIAIARAMLKDAPILMLDEATSALDSESERLIQKALRELMKNKTAIVIAHRLSTIQKMDRILVLDNGAVVEQGSHQELLKQDGLYAKLWQHQSGGFIDGDEENE